jgi:hypothetical protein
MADVGEGGTRGWVVAQWSVCAELKRWYEVIWPYREPLRRLEEWSRNYAKEAAESARELAERSRNYANELAEIEAITAARNDRQPPNASGTR